MKLDDEVDYWIIWCSVCIGLVELRPFFWTLPQNTTAVASANVSGIRTKITVVIEILDVAAVMQKGYNVINIESREY